MSKEGTKSGKPDSVCQLPGQDDLGYAAPIKSDPGTG
jgi:hypothetical protein